MGHVYTRKGSRFLWIKYHQNGRVIRESTETTNMNAARRMLRTREGDVERGIPIEPKVGRISFDEAVTDLLNEYQANGRTSLDDARRRIALHLEPFFRNRRMSSISTSDIRAYIAKRQTEGSVVRRAKQVERDGTQVEVPEERRPVSAGEVNRELTTLKRMFSLSVQAGKLRFKPHIPMLRENNVRSGFFEPEQYLAILKHLPESFRPVVTFAYVTGWRINSEVLTLEWRQVDLGAGEVRLDPGTTKNREGRVFYLPAKLKCLLEEQRRVADQVQRDKGMIVPHVFFHAVETKDGKLAERTGRRITGSGFYHAFRRARRAAGCPASIPHDLRRTAVRNMVRAAIPERVAMQLTGHKTRSVFERYNVVSDGDLREAARRLGDAGGHTFGHSTAVSGLPTKRDSQNS